MTRSYLGRSIAAAAAVTAVLAGCTVDGQPSSAIFADPAVQVDALDTGDYPTRARAAFGRAVTDPERVEASRMAQFVLAPFEVNPDLTNGRWPVGEFDDAAGIGRAVVPGAADVPANAEFVTGFVTTADNGDANVGAARHLLRHAVLKYRSPADASAAAEQMSAAVAEIDNKPIVPLDGAPGTRTVIQDFGASTAILAVTAHDLYVFFDRYYGPTTQFRSGESLVRMANAITQQKIFIDEFTPTPDGETPLIDPDAILIYALPLTAAYLRANPDSPDRGAVYGPRGIAHTSTDPVTDFEVLTKIGSDANAVENSAVFRADTAEGARTYLDSFLGSNRTRGWTGADNPPGLPIASCQKHPTSQAHSCALTVGRYGAQVIGNTKTDAHQQASAQYLILTTADQRAH
ncbi:hypothetical protein [Gordonia sp. SCSIO 19800]|uniref:DUF7373 family lipoprotein n=1 Tax=Gordonia sp. SCSIO 19800 TaxID=2826926 RepID=UPI001B81804A|nr:hypothetical protein [Gordonia sp. SCSIO 19800]MBR7193799.1 hypothetical protein [Gordonia sp. SCSIO 19800]